MGRRSINTTKSGKYMNPTDQARKEARKRELKKNKRQRTAVRLAVLKGKDPQKLFEELEAIDSMEFDTAVPPKLSERVLKDKRKKLKETLARVVSMYEKEDVDYAMELRHLEVAYERRRSHMADHYEQVKNAERVQLDQIPLPDAPGLLAPPGAGGLPGDIPLPVLPQSSSAPTHSILKKTSVYDKPTIPIPSVLSMPSMAVFAPQKKKPPGPPPGPPPPLSDSDDDDVDMEHPTLEEAEEILTKTKASSKSRKIRFADDDERDPDETEKDTRVKIKPGVSALQVKMLKLAGQEVPMVTEASKLASAPPTTTSTPPAAASSTASASAGDSSDESDDDDARQQKSSDSESSDEEEAAQSTAEKKPPEPRPTAKTTSQATLPPGPPPGAPPLMFIRTGAPPRLMPPGPPPGRPPGLPPGPPPGLPPNVRAPRLPSGPPGLPPPRLMRPPHPPGVGPPSQPASQSNVLSAPPSIMKPRTGAISGQVSAPPEKKKGATIEAKPQIKNMIGESTRFMPTALKVRREVKDGKGRIVKQQGKVEESVASVARATTVAGPTKDDAYDNFMREMEGLI